MKLKPLYIYIILIITAIVLLVIFSDDKKSDEIAEVNSSSIPNDDIHKGMNDLASKPSSSNVNREIINKLSDLENYVNENPTDTLKIREYADLLAAAHKQEKAISLYKRIIEIDPNRLDIQSYLAVLYYNKELYSEAKKAIANILSANPNNTEAIYNMGLIEARIGDMKAAKKQWEDLITNHPNSKMSDLAREAIESLN